MTFRRPARISPQRCCVLEACTLETHRFADRALQSIASGVIVIDQEGRVVLLNDAAIAILGLDPAAALHGRPCRQVFAAYPEIARLLLETFDTQTPPNRAEIELRHEHRPGRPIGYTLSLVRGADGRAIGAAMFFKDLTPIERLEEQARLKDRLAVLGQMAAWLAHEMRNPLAAIEIHASLLRRAVSAALASEVESVDQILQEVRRLKETVSTCLDFVRTPEVVDRPVPMEALLEAITAESGSPGARIERDYEAAGTTALGDPVQLRQVFGNLVRNAREAAGPAGTVRLRTRHDPEGPCVVVDVADDGPGIPPERRSRVFQPFFTTKPRGLGLGLAMVQKIVQAHQGRIDLISPAGGGATFRVVLRAARGEDR